MTYRFNDLIKDVPTMTGFQLVLVHLMQFDALDGGCTSDFTVLSYIGCFCTVSSIILSGIANH